MFEWKEIKTILESCASGLDIYFNLIFTSKEKKEANRKMFSERITICKSCPIYSDGWCKRTNTEVINGITFHGCGCLTYCKAALKKNSCPANKW